MGYVYVPDVPGQASGYPAPVSTNMRGSGQVQPGFYTPHTQEMFRQNPMQQTTLPAPVQPQTVPQNTGIIWVNGRQEAESYPVDPGCAVALWDKTSPVTSPVLYLRQADSTGRPITEVYDLKKRVEGSPQPQIPQIDPKQVVTWDALYGAMDDYFTKRLKQPLESTKQKENVDNA